MKKKIYSGRRDDDGAHVFIGNKPLPLEPSLKLFSHSPSGFEWGYGGSGPAQLALAILLDYFGPDEKELVVRLHQGFKWAVIAHLSRDEAWELSGEDVERVCRGLDSWVPRKREEPSGEKTQ